MRFSMDSILCTTAQPTQPQNLCQPEITVKNCEDKTSSIISETNNISQTEPSRKRKAPRLSSFASGEEDDDEPCSKKSLTPSPPWDFGESFESKDSVTMPLFTNNYRLKRE
jgi:hypothetical protein